MITEFGLHFGALSEPLAKQIKAQKLAFDKEKVKEFQYVLDAMITVRIADLVPDKVYEKMQKKLMQRITKHIAAKNKQKAGPVKKG
jgi:hypothetical protein